MLTQDRLKEIMYYSPETGLFTRIIKASSNALAGDIAGGVDGGGYVRIKIKRKLYAAHRLAVLYMEGYFPEDTVDHINRIKDDNRWENLREATRQCQNRNCSISKNNTSGIKGVYWGARVRKWCANVAVNRKIKSLGTFDDFLEAAYHRFAAEQCLGFPDCDINSSARQYIDRKRLQYDNNLTYWGPV